MKRQVLRLSEAAHELGLSRWQFYRFRKKHKIETFDVPEPRILAAWIDRYRKLRRREFRVKKGRGK